MKKVVFIVFLIMFSIFFLVFTKKIHFNKNSPFSNIKKINNSQSVNLPLEEITLFAENDKYLSCATTLYDACMIKTIISGNSVEFSLIEYKDNLDIVDVRPYISLILGNTGSGLSKRYQYHLRRLSEPNITYNLVAKMVDIGFANGIHPALLYAVFDGYFDQAFKIDYMHYAHYDEIVNAVSVFANQYRKQQNTNNLSTKTAKSIIENGFFHTTVLQALLEKPHYLTSHSESLFGWLPMNQSLNFRFNDNSIDSYTYYKDFSRRDLIVCYNQKPYSCSLNNSDLECSEVNFMAYFCTKKYVIQVN